MKRQKSAIALLITVMFVMLISVAIGYGLTQLNKASKVVKNEKMLYQSSMILEDVLNILKTSSALQSVADNNSSEDLFSFLSSSGFIPVTLGNLKLLISIENGREKLNINTLNKKNINLFRQYFNTKMVGSAYVDILQECMRKNQAPNEYNNYTSALFDMHPRLFREYIASQKHLDIINDFYLKEYGDENIQNVDFDALFTYGENNNTAVDLNYVKPAVWELMLGSSQERALSLYQGRGAYKSLKDLELSAHEKVNIAKFKTTFFAPVLFVQVKIVGEKSFSIIKFFYDIELKRGYDFVFEV